jgi:hypothetical protein
MNDLHIDEQRFWREKIRDLDRQLRNQLEAKEEDLEAMEDSMYKLRKDRARRAARPSYKPRITAGTDEEDERTANDAQDKEQQMIVSEVQGEVAQTRNA